MITSNIYSETNTTLIIRLIVKENKEYFITVIKPSGYTNEQLLTNWTRRAKIYYMRNPFTFTRGFIDRINARHLFLAENM